ncbi:hypothetical protein HY643_00005 [Candidatus Woesearchaeota archaeon]|nr:hypothetical protein [Candidatus Woesearchaeota archaeon]
MKQDAIPQELEPIEKLVNKYAPMMEKKFKVKIGKVELKERLLDRAIVMAMGTSLHPSSYPNLLIVNSLWTNFLESVPDRRERSVIHELSHVVYHRITNPHRDSFSLYRTLEGKTLEEGFAEYIKFSFPKKMPQKDVELQQEQRWAMSSLPKNNKLAKDSLFLYEAGYRFIKSLVDGIGEEIFLKYLPHMRIPTKEEIINPNIYLNKNNIGGQK